MEFQLTEIEKQKATENHNLVFHFLSKHNLNVDEYYDVVVFGYLKAVKIYSERKELQKYAFSTIAYRQMNWTLKNFWKYLYRQKRYANVYSLDACTENSQQHNLSIYEVQSNGVDEPYHEVECKMMFENAINMLNELEMETMHMKYMGYNDGEIAKAKGIKITVVKEILEQALNKTCVAMECAF